MTDIYADARIVAQRHREQGAAEERAKIVAWLRKPEQSRWPASTLINPIEAKEHLK
jgi:hypothetical protein